MRDKISTSVAPIERKYLDKIFPPKARSAFEQLQGSPDAFTLAINDLTEDMNLVERQPLLTFDAADPILENARKINGPTNVTVTVGTETVDLDLSDTGVNGGVYGDQAHVIALTIDAKGRITAAQAFVLNTTNITEGAKLFFTTARARNAISASAPINYDSGSGNISVSGFSGTVSPVTSITVDGGIVTAAA